MCLYCRVSVNELTRCNKMAKKKEYLPKRIREGVTADQLRERVKTELKGKRNLTFEMQVNSFDHGRDVNGNGTAHFCCTLYAFQKGNIIKSFHIVESGARREQVGYSGQNEAALYALDKLGFKVDLSKAGSYDYQTCADYPLVGFLQ